MITSLFDAGQRSKRQVVKYDEIPKVLVDAVLSIEDRRFFQHGGVNFMRLAEAALDRLHPRTPRAGRIDPHHAAFPGIFSHSGEDRQAQADRNADCASNWSRSSTSSRFLSSMPTGSISGSGVPSPSAALPGVASLFQQGPEGHHSAGSGAAGGIDSGAQLSVALPPSRARARTPQSGAGQHGGNSLPSPRTRRKKPRRRR